MPPPEEVESWAKAGAAVMAFLAALWVPVSRWRARRRAERERVDLALRAVRNLLDIAVLILRDRLPLDAPWEPGEHELLHQLAILIDRREALYRADGHTPTHAVPQTLALRPPPGAAAVAAISVSEVLSRTQRIEIAEQRRKQQDTEMFADGWRGDTE